MRLVAGLARKAAGVLIRFHLREGLRSGRAGRMTADAEGCGIELGRMDRAWVAGMIGEGTMAGFAIDVGMLACLLDLEDVGMTGFACLMTREVDGTSGNLSNGGATVVTVFAEALRHNEMTDHQKDREADDEQKSKPEKMSRIPEVTHSQILSRTSIEKSH